MEEEENGNIQNPRELQDIEDLSDGGDLVAEDAAEDERFDIALAASHSYMGGALEPVRGRSVLAAGWEGAVPLRAHHGAVFPGETVPMLLPDAHDAALLAGALRADHLFGLLCPDESGTMLSGYGVLCEVFEAAVEEDAGQARGDNGPAGGGGGPAGGGGGPAGGGGRPVGRGEGPDDWPAGMLGWPDEESDWEEEEAAGVPGGLVGGAGGLAGDFEGPAGEPNREEEEAAGFPRGPVVNAGGRAGEPNREEAAGEFEGPAEDFEGPAGEPNWEEEEAAGIPRGPVLNAGGRAGEPDWASDEIVNGLARAVMELAEGGGRLAGGAGGLARGVGRPARGAGGPARGGEGFAREPGRAGEELANGLQPQAAPSRRPQLVTVKARATHRFRCLELPRGARLPLHLYERVRLARVRVLPDERPRRALPERLPSLDPLRNGRTQRGRGLRALDAAVTPWPPFLYDIFDFQRMRRIIVEYFKTLMMDKLPEEPVALSFWVASNLALGPRDRLALFLVDCALHRLHMEVRLIARRSVLCCASCLTDIARHEHMLAMSSAGVVSNYTNPGGYLHDVVTVSRAANTRPSGPPSTQYSWFPGYAWTIVLCRGCLAHVGWRFDAERRTLRPQRFYGLCRNHVQPRFEGGGASAAP